MLVGAKTEQDVTGRAGPYRTPSLRALPEKPVVGDLVEVVAPDKDHEWRLGMRSVVEHVTAEGVLVDGGSEFLFFREIETLSIPSAPRLPRELRSTAHPPVGVAS